MDDIIEPTIDYDFSKLYLGPPSTLAGGSYFTRIMYNNNKILHFQTPKCLTKQGFVKSGKKIFVDLMFDNNDTVLINWIENLETRCQELIYNKGDAWFQSKLEKDDIETAFTSPFKIYKSGKYYLLRVNVKPNIKVYNEVDEIIKIEDVTTSNYIISILEIQGIKFTSRNFQIEIEMKQTMVVSPDPFLDECFIKKPVKQLKQLDKIGTPSELAFTNTNTNTNNLELDMDTFIKDTLNELSDDTNTKNTTPSINLDTSFDTFSSNVKGIKFDKPSNKYIDNDNDDKTNLDDNQSDDIDDINIVDDNKNYTNNKPHQNNTSTSHDNIILEIEDLNFSEKEDPNDLKEVDLSSSLVNSLETITLKKPNQVHYENYKQARERAKNAKQIAIAAYLEAKNIKNTYMLDDIDDSDDSDFDDYNDDYNE
jgi:hypothetical protein